jgi:hypothetical protein
MTRRKNIFYSQAVLKPKILRQARLLTRVDFRLRAPVYLNVKNLKSSAIQVSSAGATQRCEAVHKASCKASSSAMGEAF